MHSKHTTEIFRIIILSFIISTTAGYSFAKWVEPTGTPPYNNVPPPINSGPTTQTKNGTLMIADWLMAGGVAIGDAHTPTEVLDVLGNIKASGTGGGNIAASGNIGTNGESPISGLPPGWAGGLHTFDVYAEGTVGVGTNGTIAAYMDKTGTMKAKTLTLTGTTINMANGTSNFYGDSSNTAARQSGYFFILNANGTAGGKGVSAPTVDTDIGGTLTTKSYVDGRFNNCRLCFKYSLGNVQCNRNKSPNVYCAAMNGWTTMYEDDTDGKSGGCKMQWKLDCIAPYGD